MCGHLPRRFHQGGGEMVMAVWGTPQTILVVVAVLLFVALVIVRRRRKKTGVPKEETEFTRFQDRQEGCLLLMTLLILYCLGAIGSQVSEVEKRIRDLDIRLLRLQWQLAEKPEPFDQQPGSEGEYLPAPPADPERR